MSADTPTPKGLGLGTFLGVYTPTVLTILGVILYLRMGWVVGNAGVWGTVAIVLIANVITAITAFSMSALSTNMRVGVGGAYYIISRSMGLELGGALGIPLYLSQVLSLTLYAFGLAESTAFVGQALLGWDVPAWAIQAMAAGIVIAVTALAAKSTELALKAQLPIMVFIAISLVAFVAGVDFDVQYAASWGPLEETDFWGVFAVFFPAVTGVLAGVGLSGDLKDPGKSIPRGVLTAVATGFVVYITMPFIIAHAAPVHELQHDKLVWTSVAIGGSFAILPGLFGAVLSSAIGSILGAPRTLQALAQDGLVARRLGKVDEKTGEPMLALYISGAVALGAVALGDLNAVASVVSMFFLTTYGMLNLAAGLEAWIKDPSFRPRIRVPYWISFVGAIGCFLAMALINPIAFVLAVVIEMAIWWWLSRRRLEATWGDLRSGFWFAIARLSMVQLREANVEARNWRPHILVFSGDVKRDVGVVSMAAHFGQDQGIVSVLTLHKGHLDDRTEAHQILESNQKILDDAGVLAFPEVIIGAEKEDAILTAAQANGFAGIESNMMCFRWPSKESNRLPRMLRWVRHLDDLEKSTMIMRPVKGSRKAGAGELLVWWKGKEANGDLMLLLAHLLVMSASWRGARITLASVVDSNEEGRALRKRVEEGLGESNIETQVEVLVRPADQTPLGCIRERSASASLVFLGLPRAESGNEEDAAKRLMTLVEGMPSVILVRNSSPFRGRLV
ncbi:MAG: Na-K-Cl cotransporter [Proteobacteria bacterium]|nr:Na-K-Cl cotransporter [Pseudomonadota bacterium]MCP4916652.1 Na-K-Cl cotransporter [Pseudomonadota bacterium]